MASVDPVPLNDTMEEDKVGNKDVSKVVVETVNKEVLATAKTDIAAKVETVNKDVLADARTEAATEVVTVDNSPVSVAEVSRANDKLKEILLPGQVTPLTTPGYSAVPPSPVSPAISPLPVSYQPTVFTTEAATVVTAPQLLSTASAVKKSLDSTPKIQLTLKKGN